MAHPGKIIYAHPPGRDGLRYFYVLYQPNAETWHLRYCELEGPRQQVTGEVGEVVVRLERDLSCAPYGRAATDAAGAIRRELEQN